MEKRKWPWKRKSSEKNPGESESSGSLVSSQSERCSDDQISYEAVKESPNHKRQSPEVTSGYTDCATNCEENGKPHSLVGMLPNTNNDNGPREYSTGKEYASDGLLEEATLTASATSNGCHPDQYPTSVEVVSLSATDGGSLNQDPGLGSAGSVGSSKLEALISSPQLKEATSIVMSNNLTDVDCQTLEASRIGGEENDGLKLLQEKLSTALAQLTLKDEQVKQHSTVAEEAVAGWEKTEKEVADLKQQLEAMAQQKITFEARVSHLDEALKECVRQLRLAKEEQERKVREAVAEKTHNFDLVKSKLEAQLVETQAQLEVASSKPNPSASIDADLLEKLEYLEEENIALKQELLSQSQELKVATIEGDLSTRAAETASKQHLEGIKKMAKLEVECRRLKSLLARKPLTYASDHNKLATASSSSCVESVTTDSQSDNGDSFNASEVASQKSEKNDLWTNGLIAELDNFKNGKAGFSRCGLPLPISTSVEIDLMDDFLEMEKLASMPQTASHQDDPETGLKLISDEENQLRKELGRMKSRMLVLEKTVERVEAEKNELEMALAQSQTCLERSQTELIESRMILEQLEAELQETSMLKKDLESNVSDQKLEAQAMSSKMKLLYEEIDELRIFSEEISTKSLKREKDLERKDEELELQRQNIPTQDELEAKDIALAESQKCAEALQSELIETREKLEQLEMELEKANGSNQLLKSELNCTREEGGRLSAHVKSLEAEIAKEQAAIEELGAKCRSYENVVLQTEQKLELLRNEHCNNDKKITQEELAAAAAGKLSECQKTITSLGNQLKSLATLEDFLIDTASIPGLSGSTAPLVAKGASGATWKFHSNNVYLPK